MFTILGIHGQQIEIKTHTPTFVVEISNTGPFNKKSIRALHSFFFIRT